MNVNLENEFDESTRYKLL